MDAIYRHVCGLDVHKKTVVACVLTPEVKEIRTYATMTDDLLQMVDWLKEQSVTHVAMESTGSYWKPIYNLLEASSLSPLVVNAKQFKNVPGRKTDVRDAEWIASLLQRGLLKGSFIPPRDQRELRELLKYRRSLLQERAREINRIQKVLEGANIKLSAVATDILGKSSRAMLEAIIAGEEDPEVLSALALGRLKNKREELKRALRGLIGPHLRFMLEQPLRHIDALTQLIAALDEEIERQMRLFERSLHVLGTRMMNGIGGSGDFARNARLTVFVTKSTAKGGAISSIVPFVSHVDHTEHDVDVMVTEQGLADLRGLSPRERALAIINNCAHPIYRPQLMAYVEEAVARGGHTPHVLEKALQWHIRYEKAGTMLEKASVLS